MADRALRLSEIYAASTEAAWASSDTTGIHNGREMRTALGSIPRAVLIVTELSGKQATDNFTAWEQSPLCVHNDAVGLEAALPTKIIAGLVRLN
jgi:hypothetical protein